MIRTERDGGVLILRLDRPEKRNALTPTMLRALAEAVVAGAGAGAGSRAIVLSGVGEVFCAGFDLSLCRDDEGALGAMLTGLSRCVRTLRRSPSPVVVSAHGAAVAGGCALLGGADVVVTDERARLGYPVVRLGISPAVTAPFLRLAVGDGASRVRALDPGLINGMEALRIGLAHECLATPAEAEARAIDIAREIAAKPPGGIAATKAWLNDIDGSGADADADAGLAASLGLAGSDEQRERLRELWAGGGKR